ncbi:hypothetical protein FACS1894184_08140 [Clostridia bacterium]|nr:hypothetical protein FACS1894184_08140 [Clostridia bacterium]
MFWRLLGCRWSNTATNGDLKEALDGFDWDQLVELDMAKLQTVVDARAEALAN